MKLCVEEEETITSKIINRILRVAFYKEEFDHSFVLVLMVFGFKVTNHQKIFIIPTIWFTNAH